MILLCTHARAGSSLVMAQLTVLGCETHNNQHVPDDRHPWGYFENAAYNLAPRTNEDWNELFRRMQLDDEAAHEAGRTLAVKWMGPQGLPLPWGHRDDSSLIAAMPFEVRPIVLLRTSLDDQKERIDELYNVAKTFTAPVFHYEGILDMPEHAARQLASYLPFPPNPVRTAAAALLVRSRDA